MKDRALIATGAVGVVLAAICCAAPLLAVTLATAGLTTWLANGAYVLIPALLVCLGLVAYRLNRRHLRQIAARPRRTTRKSSHEHKSAIPFGREGGRHPHSEQTWVVRYSETSSVLPPFLMDLYESMRLKSDHPASSTLFAMVV